MDTFLKIIGALTLLALLGIVAVVFFFFFKFKGWVRTAAARTPPPATISLVPDPEATWVAEAAASADLAALAALGYTRGPAYTVEGIPGIGLVALVHPGTGAHAAYYDHPTAGHWADICATVADGTEVTFTNAPTGHQMDHRPGTEKNYHKGLPLAALHALSVARLSGAVVQRVTLETYPANFADSYARDMTWRIQKDGTSEEEFMRIANERADRDKLTEEQLREAYTQTKLSEIEQRSREALAAFEKSTTLPVSEWKKYENRMVIHSAAFHPGAYANYLYTVLAFPPEDLERYREALAAGLSLEGLLQRVARDGGREVAKLGEVGEIKKFEVYGFTDAPCA